jgi:hypothetical protein
MRNSAAVVLAASVLFAGCDDAVVAPHVTADANQALFTGILDPGKGPIHTGYIIGEDGKTPTRIGYQVVNGHAIWDGDIGLGPADEIARTAEEAVYQRAMDDMRPSFSLHYNGNSYWSDTKAVIPVREVFSPTNLWSALTQIEKQVPGVNFVPYNGQYHHLVVYYGSGSNYYNGCYNGRCEIYIGRSDASKQLIMHEFGHGLGFQHEQKRCDRDSYIRMIDAGPDPAQFYTACDWVRIGGYDYSSIMHYNSREFGRLHFTDWNGYEICGYWCRTTLSAGDVAAWRKLYPSAANIIIDSNQGANGSNARFTASTNWTGSTAGTDYGAGYRWASTAAVSDGAEFEFYLPAASTKSIDAWWVSGANRSATAPFVVYNAAGTKLGTVKANQQINGGKWVALGTYNFSAGWNKVVLSRWTTLGDVVIADAVRVR